MAGKLGRLLSPRQFEQWLVATALRSLTATASAILERLSGREYGLQSTEYLPTDLIGVMRALAPGERTPVFTIGGGGTWTRHSWYLLLPGPGGSPPAGIVRLECSPARQWGTNFGVPERPCGPAIRTGARVTPLSRRFRARLSGVTSCSGLNGFRHCLTRTNSKSPTSMV